MIYDLVDGYVDTRESATSMAAILIENSSSRYSSMLLYRLCLGNAVFLVRELESPVMPEKPVLRVKLHFQYLM